MVDDYTYSANPKRLYRSRDKVIAGVCGGLAERMGWDPTLVRIAFAVLFFTGILSAVFIVYIVIWAITPVAPYRPRNLSPDEDRFWRSVSDRPAETFSNIRYKFKDMDDRLARMERSVTSEEWKLKREFRDLEKIPDPLDAPAGAATSPRAAPDRRDQETKIRPQETDKGRKRDIMARELQTRLAWAGGLLAVGMTAVTLGAQLGVVHLNAGDVKIVFGKGHDGLTMDIAARTCPPNCGFDIAWRPLAHGTSLARETSGPMFFEAVGK